MPSGGLPPLDGACQPLPIELAGELLGTRFENEVEGRLGGAPEPGEAR
jgi:hypothetical protein